ncbi:MAG: gamma-butyrobetaine hydroxylase-like domain-containing protein [Gammaproteobacteria bacterium]
MNHVPVAINLKKQSRQLVLEYADGNTFTLSCELLRVYSPSAEVRGHGPGQEVLQIGKENVNIDSIQPIGTYAVKLVFDDGHDSGLYTWDYLYDLGREAEQLFAKYLTALKAAGHERKVQHD